MKYYILSPVTCFFNKKITFLTVLVFFNVLMCAQYVVIDGSDMSGDNIQFQDTLLVPVDVVERTCLPDGTEFFVDLDNDNINDAKFRLYCEKTSEFNSYSISVTTYNDFIVHVDNEHIERFQYIDPRNNLIYDSTRNTPVVKKYNQGDTIYYNASISTGPMYMHNMRVESFHVGICVVDNIYLFAGGEGYVAFTKNVLGNNSVYYIKMSLSTESGLQLMSAKTDDITYSVEEKIILSDFVYPNPASNTIRLEGKFDKVEIYSLQGSLILTNDHPDRKNQTDISGLRAGYYFVVGYDKNEKTITRLLKK